MRSGSAAALGVAHGARPDRRASPQPCPCRRSGSRWLPSAHSFHDLTQSSRSSSGRSASCATAAATLRSKPIGRRAGDGEAPPARPRRVVPVRVHARLDAWPARVGVDDRVRVRPHFGTAEHLAARPHPERGPPRDLDGEPHVHPGVEAVGVGVGVSRAAAEQVAHLGDEVEPVEARAARHALPSVDERRGIGQLLGPEDVEDRLAVDAEVALIPEGRQDALEVGQVVLGARVGLLLEHPVRRAVPRAGPRLIRPGEREPDVGLAAGEHLPERTIEDAVAPAEPVVPVDERLDAVAPRELGLGVTGLGHPQVVEAEVGGKGRLLVAAEERSRARDVGPLREARTPPFVVLGDREELRKVEGECAGGEGLGGHLQLAVPIGSGRRNAHTEGAFRCLAGPFMLAVFAQGDARWYLCRLCARSVDLVSATVLLCRHLRPDASSRSTACAGLRRSRF